MLSRRARRLAGPRARWGLLALFFFFFFSASLRTIRSCVNAWMARHYRLADGVARRGRRRSPRSAPRGSRRSVEAPREDATLGGPENVVREWATIASGSRLLRRCCPGATRLRLAQEKRLRSAGARSRLQGCRREVAARRVERRAVARGACAAAVPAAGAASGELRSRWRPGSRRATAVVGAVARQRGEASPLCCHEQGDGAARREKRVRPEYRRSRSAALPARRAPRSRSAARRAETVAALTDASNESNAESCGAQVVASKPCGRLSDLCARHRRFRRACLAANERSVNSTPLGELLALDRRISPARRRIQERLSRNGVC